MVRVLCARAFDIVAETRCIVTNFAFPFFLCTQLLQDLKGQEENVQRFLDTYIPDHAAEEWWALVQCCLDSSSLLFYSFRLFYACALLLFILCKYPLASPHFLWSSFFAGFVLESCCISFRPLFCRSFSKWRYSFTKVTLVLSYRFQKSIQSSVAASGTTKQRKINRLQASPLIYSIHALPALAPFVSAVALT